MNSGLPVPMEAGMPYVSDAQRRWAHTKTAKKAGFPTAEFDKESKGKKLPEKAGKRRHKVSYPSPKRK